MKLEEENSLLKSKYENLKEELEKEKLQSEHYWTNHIYKPQLKLLVTKIKEAQQKKTILEKDLKLVKQREKDNKKFENDLCRKTKREYVHVHQIFLNAKLFHLKDETPESLRDKIDAAQLEIFNAFNKKWEYEKTTYEEYCAQQKTTYNFKFGNRSPEELKLLRQERKIKSEESAKRAEEIIQKETEEEEIPDDE
jgi:hypothetical protein